MIEQIGPDHYIVRDNSGEDIGWVKRLATWSDKWVATPGKRHALDDASMRAPRYAPHHSFADAVRALEEGEVKLVDISPYDIPEPYDQEGI